MTRYPQRAVALAGAVCAASVLSFPAHAVQAVGEARGADGGELRYTEHHSCSEAGTLCQVEYRDTQGNLFARKSLDYSLSKHAPSLELEYLPDGRTLRVEREATGDLVVDAGFDHYMRSSWDMLAQGEPVQFEFLPAGRDAPLSMRAEPVEEACPNQRLCVKVRLDNWLLGAVVPPIRLQYDRDNQRLMQYLGISNLRDSDGNSQQVRIDYSYPVASDPVPAERS